MISRAFMYNTMYDLFQMMSDACAWEGIFR